MIAETQKRKESMLELSHKKWSKVENQVADRWKEYDQQEKAILEYFNLCEYTDDDHILDTSKWRHDLYT